MKADELMNQWLENTQAAIAPVRALNEIALAGATRLGEQNMAVTKSCMDLAMRGMQLAASARDPRALVSKQTELTKEMGEQLLASAEAYTKIATETQEELKGWVEQATEAAVSKAEATVAEAA